jgi:hypothetical protein
MLSEKTKVGISLSTLAMLIIAIVTFASTWAAWKTNMERNDMQNKADHVEIRRDIDLNTTRIEAFQPDIIEMKTDLKWIRAAMEKGVPTE